MSRLPSDTPRQLANLLTLATVTAVDMGQTPAKVKVSLDGGKETDWIPFGNAFIGGTRIVCAPKVGVSGLLVSEGGEMEVLRFIPCFLTQSNDLQIGGDEFLIKFNNGDEIKHIGGTITVNVSGKAIVNSGGETNVTASTVNINTPETNVSEVLNVGGTLNLGGNFNHTGEGTGGGSPAQLNYGAQANATINVTGGDVVADGVSLKTVGSIVGVGGGGG